MQAVAGGVDENGEATRADTAQDSVILKQAGKLDLGAPRPVVGGDAVGGGVRLRFPDAFLYLVDPGDSDEVGVERQAERSHAAIQVEEQIARTQRLAEQRQHHLRTLGVHLEEGQRRECERHIAQRNGQGLCSDQHFLEIADRGVGELFSRVPEHRCRAPAGCVRAEPVRF